MAQLLLVVLFLQIDPLVSVMLSCVNRKLSMQYCALDPFGRVHEEPCLLDCNVVYLGEWPTYTKNLSPSSSRSKGNPNNMLAELGESLHEDGADVFLQMSSSLEAAHN
jgi:hypothetical protein